LDLRVPEQRLTVFLDRDGVINRKRTEGRYVTRWAEFEFAPGAIEALRLLKATGARLIVVTNQRGIAMGCMSARAVAEIHARMQAVLAAADAAVDAIFVCPHEEGTCDCRKPRLGLFRAAVAADPAIDLSRAVVIGDSASDLQAGNDLGVPTFLVAPDPRRATILAANRRIHVDGAARTLLDLVVSTSMLETCR
jgi:histidinol-phosphate phosphatase family protein